MKKAHSLAIGAEILGERWARDHADDKKARLAAALEVAFDPAKNDACIALGQAARDSAGAWMPPGMTYDGGTSNGASMDLDVAARADADGAGEGVSAPLRPICPPSSPKTNPRPPPTAPPQPDAADQRGPDPAGGSPGGGQRVRGLPRRG